MKKLILLFSLLILSVCVFGENIVQDTERCSADTFCIMPWGSAVSEGDRVDFDAFFGDIYECGFNLTGFIPSETIPLAKKHNLKVSVADNSDIDYNEKDLNKRYTDWAVKVREEIGAQNLDSVFQVYVKDEPTLADIPVLSAQANAVIKTIGCKPYINLNPNYADKTFLGGEYDVYLDRFLKECNLDYISYDNYSLFVGKGLDEDRFYDNIEAIRTASVKNKVDFVNIILSIAHFNYAVPDDYSINVQGWSTLAYGGRGLSYFLFSNIGYGNYRDSAYYRNGYRTPLWYTIRDMNLSIHNIMPYYKDLESVNVFHVGNVPKGCRGIESAKVVQTVSATIGAQNITEDKPNFLVGEFVGKDGCEYAIIVNKDPKWSININNFSFLNGKKLTQIIDICRAEKEQPFTGEARWIAPGHGILLKGEPVKGVKFEPISGWKFIKDAENRGESLGYFKENFDYSAWQNITVNECWEQTIGDYDGYGWYKTKTEFKDIKDNEKIYLHVGAADEDAWVYINGKLILEHTCAKLGLEPHQIWDQPFVFDITPYIKKGKNDITVKVHDNLNAGGLWAGVNAVYADRSATPETVLQSLK